ncbi:isochorismatase family protein [Paenibacillus sepulcri]|uniref:Isochorismatase family protein n=1 Tax=Paenibacillus sepulcri TaxID=359917 RepID=A0ABS7CFC9_9BACL|nr:isochorismatase family protein [Paenibacillus sepulcri]
MKIGLLIVDMQNVYLNGYVEKAKIREASEYINYVSNMMRDKEQTVIHIQDMDGADEDTDPEAREIVPEIVVGPKDIRVEKLYSNGFWKTDLEQVLRDQGVGFIVVAGFSAEYCVTFTTNGALERGFQAAILQRGIISANNEAVSSTYRDRHVVSYPAIKFMLSELV